MTARAYTAAFVALLVLTAASFGVSMLDLGHLGVPVALAIATAKGLIVALVFMHLLRAPFAYRLTLILGVAFMLLLLAFTLLDLATRWTVSAT